jgi:hypothetical protein
MSQRELFYEQGFTNTFKVFKEPSVLNKIKQMIYDYTKNDLENHDVNLDLDKKLTLKFKKQVSQDYATGLRRFITNSDEYNNIINHLDVKEKFKLIFKEPILYKINGFRWLLPTEENISLPFHQDECTWYLFKDNYYQNKLIGTMWLSINGSNKLNSIELIKKNQIKDLKLFDHKFIKNTGYFGGSVKKNILKNNQNHSIETAPGEAIIFHNLTFHRTINDKNRDKMIPRYSIDLRYYDKNEFLNYSVDYIFKLKKLASKFNII